MKLRKRSNKTAAGTWRVAVIETGRGWRPAMYDEWPIKGRVQIIHQAETYSIAVGMLLHFNHRRISQGLRSGLWAVILNPEACLRVGEPCYRGMPLYDAG